MGHFPQPLASVNYAACLYKYLFESLLSSLIYLGVELLGHIVIIFLRKNYFFICLVCAGSLLLHGFSVVVVLGGYSLLWYTGFSLRWLLLWSTGSRHRGSVVAAHRLLLPTACGIFSDQGQNPCPLHWQADSYPPYCQGSPTIILCLTLFFFLAVPRSI